MSTARTANLAEALKKLYNKHSTKLPFHGWHHIYFVTAKTMTFAEEFPGINKEIVEAAALTHDLNYLVEPNSAPEKGADLRAKYLSDAGFDTAELGEIEKIIFEAHTARRHAHISDAAKVLSDADSLFKVMPITPIIFSHAFITENNVNLDKWAGKIINEQKPLLEQGVYFYTKSAKEKYLSWAQVNLQLVEQVKEALKDPDIRHTLELLSPSTRS